MIIILSIPQVDTHNVTIAMKRTAPPNSAPIFTIIDAKAHTIRDCSQNHTEINRRSWGRFFYVANQIIGSSFSIV